MARLRVSWHLSLSAVPPPGNPTRLLQPETVSVGADEDLRNGPEAVRAHAAELGLTSRPIAHRNAAISRAMAVVTTVWRLPAAISRR